MEARHLDPSAGLRSSSLLLDPAIADSLMDGEDFETDDVQLEYQRQRDAAAARKQKDVHRQTEMRKYLGLDSAGGGVASSSSGDGPRPRTFVPLKTDGYAAWEAAKFMPEGATIAKDYRENRWKVSFAGGHGTKSKSYGSRTGFSDFDAMKYVVLYAWSQSAERNGIHCPWNFQETEIQLRGA